MPKEHAYSISHIASQHDELILKLYGLHGTREMAPANVAQKVTIWSPQRD